MAEKRSATEASESARSAASDGCIRRNVRDLRFESSSNDVDAGAAGSPAASGRYELVPVTLTEAKRLVNSFHEHNEAPEGWKFGTGVAVEGELVGIAMVGRASGRGIDQYRDVEITRVCLKEKGVYRNAASMLYGAACRMAAAGGYRTAYTYTLEEEDAASVKAAGFVLDAELGERPSWSTSSRPRYEATLFGPRKRPGGRKRRWRRELARGRADGGDLRSMLTEEYAVGGFDA